MPATTAYEQAPLGAPLWGRTLRRPNRLGPVARALAAWAVAWVPLAAYVLFQPGYRHGFVVDLPIHARLLVTLPLLILCRRWTSARLVVALQTLRRSQLIPGHEEAKVAQLDAQVERLRDSKWILAGFGVLSVLLSALQTGDVPAWRADGFARGWLLLVAGPLLRFVVIRWLWWMLLWARWIIGVARLDLRLVATHPDGRCGLGFLSDGVTSFSWVALAIAAPVVATAHSVGGAAMGPKGFPEYLAPLVLVAVGVVLLAFGPLIAFVAPMRAERRRSLMDFSVLVAHQSRQFRAQWLDQARDSELLGAPDFSAINDLQDTFVRSQGKPSLPFKPSAAAIIAAGAFAPAIPFLLFDRRLVEVALKVLQALG